MPDENEVALHMASATNSAAAEDVGGPSASRPGSTPPGTDSALPGGTPPVAERWSAKKTADSKKTADPESSKKTANPESPESSKKAESSKKTADPESSKKTANPESSIWAQVGFVWSGLVCVFAGAVGVGLGGLGGLGVGPPSGWVWSASFFAGDIVLSVGSPPPDPYQEWLAHAAPWLFIVGFALLLCAIGFPFKRFICRLGRARQDFQSHPYEDLLTRLSEQEADLRVGSWWVFNLALVSLAFGVAISLHKGGDGVVLAPLALVLFTAVLIATFFGMSRSAKKLQTQIVAILAADAKKLDPEVLKPLKDFFDLGQPLTPLKMVQDAMKTPRRSQD